VSASVDHTPDRLRVKVREQCSQISLQDLRVVIAVHRVNCHQADCPILSIMEQDAQARSLTP
jgi:hypothetical protein